ncbi:hypothetical protein NQ314_000834 [Rhamnusium bicolor]|uniref:DDE-1 domain-containing protein n=1 Tax=Rhamnusium bicolor TaxID=1586634 RepID=A0AAV8ZW13_9CUCU|nr:hypothetical protein NQ314_000834 [Rhamnusium bicolor]
MKDRFQEYLLTCSDMFHGLTPKATRRLAYEYAKRNNTGVTTVHRVPRIIDRKGQHQVGQVTSRERGELVTQAGIICANGTSLPPVCVFPRQRFDEKKMMKGVPNQEDGPMGLVYPSEWMTAAIFLKVLQFFHKHVKSSIDEKSIDYCRDHGIVILTLPPHTSNRLQPLDKTVFGPFKIYFNQSADNWMLNHPAETITIYDLPELCYKSWDLATTPSNAKSGFLSTGICPYNRNIFKEEDFLGAFVTDRAYKETEPNRDALENKENESDINIPSTSSMESEENKKDKEKIFTSPELIRPIPKTGERKKTTNGRKGKCKIATDTPEKQEIEEKLRKKKTRNLRQ